MFKSNDEVFQVYKATKSIEDTAIYFDYDSKDEFIKEFEAKISSQFDFWINTQKIKVESEEHQQSIRDTVERKKTSDYRLFKPILKTIEEYSQSLSPAEEIMTALGLTEDELDTIIKVYYPKETFKNFVDRSQITTKIKLRKAQIDKGLHGSEKLLIHLGEVELGQKKKDQAINLNISISKLIEEAHKEISLEKDKYRIESDEPPKRLFQENKDNERPD